MRPLTVDHDLDTQRVECAVPGLSRKGRDTHAVLPHHLHEELADPAAGPMVELNRVETKGMAPVPREVERKLDGIDDVACGEGLLAEDVDESCSYAGPWSTR